MLPQRREGAEVTGIGAMGWALVDPDRVECRILKV